jgi:hypothetical protein
MAKGIRLHMDAQHADLIGEMMEPRTMFIS